MWEQKNKAIKQQNDIEDETIKDVEKRTEWFIQWMQELIKAFEIAIYPVNAVNEKGEVELGIKFKDLKEYGETK